MVLLPPDKSLGGTYGIDALSSNKISFKNTLRSQFPFTPDTFPEEEYWNPIQLFHIPLFWGVVTPYSAIQSGYIFK